MSTERRSEDRPASKGNIAEHVSRVASQKPPAPEGKGIVMVVLAVVVVVAAIWQLMSGSGPAKEVRDRHPEIKTPAAREEPGTGPVEMPVPMPGQDLVLPEGISERTARAIRLSLNPLRVPPSRDAGMRELQLLAAEDGMRHLAEVVAEAEASERPVLRAFLLEQILVRFDRPDLTPLALDAALRLLAAADADEEAVAALDRLARDEDRPLHVRVLAVDQLVHWDAVSDDLRAALQDAPPALRDRLR
jgi:hypothetical protein